MPNYYYVKSTLTGTGDQGRYTSQQTGAFPTGTGGYATLEDAVNATTAPADGDYICISDASAYSGTQAYRFDTASDYTSSAGKGVTVITVSDSNCDQSAVASTAQEYITGGASDWFPLDTQGAVHAYYGVYAKCDDDIGIGTGSVSARFVKCKFEVTGAGDAIGLDGTALGTTGDIVLIDCELAFGDASAVATGAYGTSLLMQGGSCTGSATTFLTFLFWAGGSFLTFRGVDLAAFTTALVNEDSSSANFDSGYVDFRRCRLASGVSICHASTVLKWGQIVRATNCAHDSTAEWQFFWREEQCEAEAVSSTYRNQSVAWPITGSKTSIAIDVATSGNTSPMRPFIIDLPSRYSALSASATDEVTVYLSGESGLTDKKVWIELIYPDGTNSHVPNQVFSSGAPFDPFATGTALTSDTGSSWTSGGAANYRISVNTGTVDAGTSCVPIIRLYVQGLSSTLYVDSQVDLS